MKAIEIFNIVKTLGTWIDWNLTTDSITWGDPEKQVERLAVAWMPTNEVLEKCIEFEADALLTHEMLFNWLHDAEPGRDDRRFFNKKLKLLADSGLTIIRNHDTWDLLPEIGIRDSWLKFLGYDENESLPLSAENDYEKVLLPYLTLKKIPPVKLNQLCENLLEKIKCFGVSEIQSVGDSEQTVESLMFQTGALGLREQINFAWKNNAGAAIFTDELNYWSSVYWAKDVGQNCIIIPHAVTEAPGMESMAKYFQDRLPDVEVALFPEGTPHFSVS
jgi:putative NIF3 family GTP cyclohydrolase 1 type 2